MLNIRQPGNVAAGIAIGLMAVLQPLTWAWAGPLSAEETRLLKTGLEAVEKSNSSRARANGARIKDPLARKILKWSRLIQPDPNASFDEISKFMAENPDWPAPKELQRRAEEAMSPETPADVVLDWFKGLEPLSGDGKARLGEALLAVDRRDQGKSVIRDAWINGNFTKRRERAFYKRHRRLLTVKDHRKRLARLQWQGRYWPARRMLWKVKPEYRALGVARLFLRHRRGNVDKAIAKVPDRFKKDPGLVYERLRWRRRYGKYDSAKEILDNPPDDLVNPERWWIERSAIARRTLIKGNASEAYRLARTHGQKTGAAYAEAEWLAGWIALRFLDDPETAKGHFMSMHYAVKYPVSQARGAYWTARAMEAMGDQTLAEDWHRLAADHPMTYYGQLSTARLRPGGSLELPPPPDPSDEDKRTFNAHELTKAVRMLAAIGENDRLKPFILRLDELAKTPGWRLLSAEEAVARGRSDLSVTVSKRAARQGLKLAETAFPLLTLPPLPAKSNPGVEVPLVLAVVRQESAFYVKAKSHANAQGLMQLLPRTAFKVAKRLRVPFHRRRLITDGDYNLTLGQAYLRELVDEFKGSYVLALVAYNAGPGRARQWLRKNGDLRSSAVDSIDWVEKIPFRETRNYVQRVLENLQVYRSRLSKTEVALRLESDLHQ